MQERAVVHGEHLVRQRGLLPCVGQFAHLVGALECEIASLRGVVGQVVELPLAVVVTLARQVKGHGMPAVAVVAPMTAELLVLLAMVRRRLGVGEQPGEARARERIDG